MIRLITGKSRDGMTFETIKKWFVITPGGTLVYETGSFSRKCSIKKLLRDAAHMPYQSWNDFKLRGYKLEQHKVLKMNKDSISKLTK